MISARPGEDSRTIAALRRRPEIRALSRLIVSGGNEAWIVGGAVRDAFLRRASPEIDVAVARDAEGLALELERQGFGRAVFVSRGRPGPRVFRVAGRRPLDIAEIEGESIAADLGRRDFTVNAMAVSLTTGEVLDPFGGRRDLAARRLRCVAARNLREDPLRALRAARLMATHGLLPDRAATEASRRAAGGLRRVAPERIASELGKLLEAPSAAGAIAWALRAGILPASLGLRLTPARAGRAARSLRALESRSLCRLEPSRRRRLRLARIARALDLSPVAARSWLRDRRVSHREGEDVSRTLELAARALAVRDRAQSWQWILDAGSLAPDALLLLAMQGSHAARRAAALRRLERRPVRRVPVNGDDLLRWLDVAPGPGLGELLARVRLAAAMGTVRNRREARNWLSGQGGNAPHRL